jgi:glycosyltransferase involved in cell wall biosynthesis
VEASIVIRAKNEARDIGNTLDAIYQQRFRGGYEVVVVDSGSTDGTLEIARKYPARLIEIPAESFTYGYALNVGVRASRGNIVVALSAHSLPVDESWLAELTKPFADPSVGGVYGRHVPRESATAPELFGMWLSGVTSSKPRRQTRDMMFSNANGAFRRALALEHPFDEHIPGAEDLAWADWILRNGWTVCYQPTGAVYHSHGESLWKLLRRMAKDQPTIWGLKLGLIDRRGTPQEQPTPVRPDL